MTKIADHRSRLEPDVDAEGFPLRTFSAEQLALHWALVFWGLKLQARFPHKCSNGFTELSCRRYRWLVDTLYDQNS